MQNQSKLIYSGGFINQFDINKLIAILKDCDTEEIYYFYVILNEVYMQISNIKDYYTCDLNDLKLLKDSLNEMVGEKIDKVKKCIILWVQKRLGIIIARLEN